MSFKPSEQTTILNKFLKWYEDRQISGSITSIAYESTSFIGLANSVGVLNFIADDGLLFIW